MQPLKYIGTLLLLIITIYSISPVLAQKYVADYTGTTQNLVPEGWLIEANQNGEVYTWIAKESDQPVAPSIIMLIFRDMEGIPWDLLQAVLEGTVSEIKVEDQREVNENEAHYLLEGVIGNLQAKIAALVVRDPGQYLFINFFAAVPDQYRKWGEEQLLYDCLQQNNVFKERKASYSNTESSAELSEYAYLPDGSFNMQSPELQRHILANSKNISYENMIGQWMQVMSYNTGFDYQNVVSGQVHFGSRGYAHIFTFKEDGTYSLSYTYKNSSSICGENTAQMTENGKYKIDHNQLILFERLYSGEYFVCYQKSTENNKKGTDLYFKVAMHSDGNHIVITGQPFEYSISTDFDEQGKSIVNIGCKRSD